MLAAAALAAVWCALPQQWPLFLDWAQENGYISRDEAPSRDFMLASSAGIELLLREARTEALLCRWEQEL